MTNELLKKRIDSLERRVSYLEKLVMPNSNPKVLSPDDIVFTIIDITSSVMNVDKTMVIGKSSIPTVCDARRICYCLCKEFTTLSLPEIGKKIGNRQHTTVLDGIRKHQGYYDTEPMYKKYYNQSFQLIMDALRN